MPSRSTGWLNGLAAGEQAEAFTLQRDGTCRRQSMPVRDRIFVERAALVHHLQLEAEHLHGPRCEQMLPLLRIRQAAEHS